MVSRSRWLLCFAVVWMTAMLPARALTLYPSHAELIIDGRLESAAMGEHQQLLPLPAGASAALADLLSLQLPAQTVQQRLITRPGTRLGWPEILKDQPVQVSAGSRNNSTETEWREAVVREIVAGNTLLVELDGQLLLFPPDDWSRLRLPAALLTDKQTPEGFALHYLNRQALSDTRYHLRLAYRGVQWQMRYQLQGDSLLAELVIMNHGQMALQAEQFDLVPLATARPMPRAAMADGMEMAMTRDKGVQASSALGIRRYHIQQPLALAAEQSQRQLLDQQSLTQAEHTLLVSDWLFNRLDEHTQPVRQLRFVWPETAVALPGGELQLLADDGLTTLGMSHLRALEPGRTQTVSLGGSSLISVSKQFLSQTRQSARIRLTFTNHSDEPQLAEYWLQGVRQVDQQEVPPVSGYRLRLQLAPGETVTRQFQGWRAE